MLSNVMSLRSGAAALVAATAIAVLPAAPAQAWGDKEQSFVAGVATAVIVDRILRQAPLFPTVRSAPPAYFVDPTPVRPVTAAPSVTRSIYRTPAAVAFQSYSPAERKAIQRQLRAWGYYRGGIDGAFGPGTYRAVVAFADDEGMTTRLGETRSAYGIYDSLLY
jgi:hypothetical protein